MNIFDSIFGFIYIPFGMLFKGCYLLIGNYGLAIILFAVIAKVAMIPFGIKQEKSRLLMMSVQPKMQQLQAKYKGNTRDPKYMEEMQALYEKEGYSPMKGCLPSLLQLPIIWAIWTAIRNPFSYMFNLSNETIINLAKRLFETMPDFANVVGNDINRVSAWVGSNQIQLYGFAHSEQGLNLINSEHLIPSASDFFTIDNLNFNFLGLFHLGDQPSFSQISWLWLFPIISGLTSFLVGYITQKMNSVQPVSGDNVAKSSSRMMMIAMPIISVFISFGFSLAISLYWIVSNILSIVQAIVLPKIMNRNKKEPEPEIKEKKLNYNQIEKMEKEKNKTVYPTKGKNKKKKK